jgi:hypothetical protein
MNFALVPKVEKIKHDYPKISKLNNTSGRGLWLQFGRLVESDFGG